MNDHSFRELEDRTGESLAERLFAKADLIRKMEAQSIAAETVDKMKAEGKAYELSDEEENMLNSFRRFRLRMRKNGEVFKWQTRMPCGVYPATETAEIVHPQEIL